VASKNPDAGLRVLVVGDDPLARGGIAGILSAEPGIDVVGQAASEEAERAAAASMPDASVWDLGSDEDAALDGLAVPAAGSVPTLALVPSEESAAGAIAAGARGVVLRDAEPPRIAAALRAVARGLVVLDEAPAASLLRPPPPSPEGPAGSLTAREMEVLHLLAEGLTNRAIAERLHISEHTAKFHVNAILGKLGASSRTEAVVRAARLGLTSL
jgi:DNA-binding NarL/FixJ family response regulator